MTEAAKTPPSLRDRLRERVRRLVSGATGRDALRAFVVPGPEVARALGLDLEAAGLEISSTPRHANALLLVGSTTGKLREAAVVAYAGMPRPRVMLALGAGNTSPLPEPDVFAPLEQKALERAAAGATERLAEKALDPNEDAVPEAHEDHEESNEKRADHSHEASDEGREAHADAGHEETAGSASDEGSGEDHDAHAGHESMGHGDPGFMSMVAMTEGTPRSGDGLQMEWVAAPFGPLFPGLPGGLSLTLTLDGDTVAESDASSVVGMRRLEGMSGPAETFAGWLAGLDPLSPVAYRVLALRAFEDAAGIVPDDRTTLARIGAMERERAASHLGWLASLGHLTGHARLAKHAAKMQLALLHAGGSAPERLRATGANEISRLKTEANGLIENLRRNILLTRRFENIAPLPDAAETSGPVSRARGAYSDARAEDEGYRSLGFEEMLREGDDALSRILVRLDEVSHSLDLILAAGFLAVPNDAFDYGLSGKGEAAVETPRGKATLRLSLAGRGTSGLELNTPSTKHLELVASVAEGRELADALVGVASLDLSPWEVLH